MLGEEGRRFASLQELLSACVARAMLWDDLLKQMALSHEALMLAEFATPSAWQAPVLTLDCEQEMAGLISDAQKQALSQALSGLYSGERCEVVLAFKEAVQTPSKRYLLAAEQREQAARARFLAHPQVVALTKTLHAVVDMESVAPLDEA